MTMFRVALAQILAGPDPQANLDLVAEQVDRAAEAGAALVVFPEATMRCFGLPLTPIAEPVDGPWAHAAAWHRRRRRSGRGGRDVHPRRGRPGAQHAARGRPRRGCALRQDPPVRRLRFPRVGHRRSPGRSR